MAGMQMLPTGLLSCEESMVFIVDLGASRTLTFEKRDFVPGMLKLYAKPLVLTEVSGTLEIKGEGAIQFQVIMDDGNGKEITTKAYWIPEMKCRSFSPKLSFFSLSLLFVLFSLFLLHFSLFFVIFIIIQDWIPNSLFDTVTEGHLNGMAAMDNTIAFGGMRLSCKACIPYNDKPVFSWLN